MNILGLSTFADSSAAIVKEGTIVCAVEEERLNRVKHFNGLPWLSIRESLGIARMSLDHIDTIAIGWNPFLGWKTRIVESAKAMYRMPEALKSKLSRGDAYIGACMNILTLKKLLRTAYPRAAVRQNIRFVEHHYAHAASTFLASPYDHADIIVADGIGESATISIFTGDGLQIKRIRKVSFPHSLGHVYASVTGFLGFRMTHDEGKVMALAGFGQDEYRELFLKLIRYNPSSKTVEVDTGLLDYHAAGNGIYSKRWIEATGLHPRKEGDLLTQQHMDLACSLQNRLEETVLELLREYFGDTPARPLCSAGGLFLNSVLNGKIVRQYNEDYFIQPAAGDNGVSIGAALHVGSLDDREFKRHPLRNVSLGRSYGDAELRQAFRKFSITPRESPDIYSEASGYIADQKILGWFRGGMEFGPRALGNRSIFASPLDRRMKDMVNMKVKHREEFRPFGGLVILEEADEYFEDVHESPFMLKVFYFRKKYRTTFPAITHRDYSCRIQTVDRSQNADLYTLLQEVKRKTGHGIILNTSLNMSGKPIVNTPDEAIELLRDTDLDMMILENYVLQKEEITGGT